MQKTIDPESLERLQNLANGNRGSSGEISLSYRDLVPLAEFSTGEHKADLDALVQTGDRSVMVAVPVLCAALKTIVAMADVEEDEAPTTKTATGTKTTTATKKAGK